MEISKEEIARMVQEAYIEGFNSAIECLKSAKDGVVQTFATQQSFAMDGATCSECGGGNGGHYVTCSQVF